MALHPEYLRGWAFVASYSSATVAEFHGVPCTDVLRHERSQRTWAERKQRSDNFKKIRPDTPVKTPDSYRLNQRARRLEPKCSLSARRATDGS